MCRWYLDFGTMAVGTMMLTCVLTRSLLIVLGVVMLCQ